MWSVKCAGKKEVKCMSVATFPSNSQVNLKQTFEMLQKKKITKKENWILANDTSKPI